MMSLVSTPSVTVLHVTGTPKMEEVHDLLKTKVQELSEAWHLAVTITAHCVLGA